MRADSGLPIHHGPSACVGVGEPVELEMIPEFVTLFRHLSSECESLASGVVVKNNTSEPIHIEDLGVAPETFEVAIGELPQELAPGASLSLKLNYVSDDPGSAEGKLVVVTDRGCNELRIRGLGTKELLSSHSDFAIDFGEIVVGTSSEVRDFTFLTQTGPSSLTSSYEGFSAEPSDAFEIFSAPKGEVQPDSCEELTVRIRFNAPSRPGPVSGSLSFRVTTESPDGTAEALALVPLSGIATNP